MKTREGQCRKDVNRQGKGDKPKLLAPNNDLCWAVRNDKRVPAVRITALAFCLAACNCTSASSKNGDVRNLRNRRVYIQYTDLRKNKVR
jgi:hypothetical protein